jgi:hypothetical protein
MAKQPVKPDSKTANPFRPNLWGMLRDVLIASINKGQLLLCMVGFLLGLMIYKMPGQDVSKLFYDVIRQFKSIYYLGWTISGCLIVAWSLVHRQMRKGFSKESIRLHKEINELQKSIK